MLHTKIVDSKKADQSNFLGLYSMIIKQGCVMMKFQKL